MRAAVIGLGRIGFEFGLDKKRKQPASHLDCYRSMNDIAEIAVCDVDKNKLALVRMAYYISDEANPFRMKEFTDYRKMLQEFQPQIVSICTPTPTHASITCEVANHPSVKAIFLEKPIAQSLEEADRIIKACEKNQIKLAVNYTRRWHPLWQATKKLSHFDEIISIVGFHHGPLLRTGTHMLDIFNWYIGREPINVQAFGYAESNYLTSSNDYNISGHITYEDNIEATIVSGKQKPYLLFEVDIFRRESRTKILENGKYYCHYKKFPSDKYSNIEELKPCEVVYERSLPINRTPLYNAITQLTTSIYDVITQLANSIYKPLCTGEDARKALEVALALHYSAMNGNTLININEVPKNYVVVSH